MVSLHLRREFASPNHEARVSSPTLLVLHYTGMPTASEALEKLCDPAAKVSAHYVVDENGDVYALVDEARTAWHAGVSYWRGLTNVNPISIGIEIVNPGHEWGYRAFSQAQMQTLAVLCRDIVTRHNILARDVVGHSDIAPSRKTDPGELFDWQWLAAQGVGLWPSTQPSPSVKAPLAQGEAGPAVNELQAKLAQYGYNAPLTGVFDETLCKTVIAFQRHFRPNNIEGIWDSECESLLDALNRNVK